MLKIDINQEILLEAFHNTTFGIEKEALRTQEDGRLALSDHPRALGDRSYHPYIQTDFSESQPEIITPICGNSQDVYQRLQALSHVLEFSLEEGEYIWPFSMPNILPEDAEEIPIIRVSDQSQVDYREMLSQKYGRRLQTISGIHFNLGWTPAFLEKLYEAQETEATFLEFNNALYMKVSKGYMQTKWLITYLFGASPVAHESFFDPHEDFPKHPARSLRNSTYGYVNHSQVDVSYDSFEDYAGSIRKMIEIGDLEAEREYYGSARPRGGGLDQSEKTGIKYVEFRSFDNNPFEVTGISLEQIEFLHAYFIYLLFLEEDYPISLEEAARWNDEIALEDPRQVSKYQKEGLAFLDDMLAFYANFPLPDTYKQAIEKARALFENPEQTLSAQILQEMETDQLTFIQLGLKIAVANKEAAIDEEYLLKGYEDMEMSTQLVMRDALQKGLEVEVMDRRDQFIRLAHGDHEEIVKNANKTSKDTYISPLIMENKTMTKKVLARAGYPVPAGGEYASLEDALGHYTIYADQAENGLVVKPKSTNMGIGITILDRGFSLESYRKALETAFSYDDQVLVEEFIEGQEYRFFVLDGETLAILKRVPAHVVGDGVHTIKDLVDQKNQDPLRGTGHRKPLEKIQLGEFERAYLADEGYTPESIPEAGVQVFLRENSNISTGGDSIDVTDQVHESYKKVAADMAQVLGATITGIDLIIKDIQAPLEEDESSYSCIEANFNPAMHMQQYVAEGQGRRLSLHVLDLLFPELDLLKEGV